MKFFILRAALCCLLANSVVYGAMQKMQYDGNGNMVSGNGLFYEYNDANRLVRVREKASDGPVISEYWYDYKGQRVKKVENGITTYYLGKQYEERRGQSTNEKSNFFFVGGQRVAKKIRINNASAQVFYYLNNHLGSTEFVTNGSGTLVDHVEYYPYGAVLNKGAERYGYTGKERDKVTGLNYYEARFYNSLSRHFTQADTITPNVYAPQSLNRYSYVQNNPLKYVDPSGHWPSWAQNSWNHMKNGTKLLNPVAAFSSVGAPDLANTPSTYRHQWKSNRNRLLFHSAANISSNTQQNTSTTLKNQKESVVPALEAMQGIGEIAKGTAKTIAGGNGGYDIAKGMYRIAVAGGKASGKIDTFSSSDLLHAPSEIAYRDGNDKLGDVFNNVADIANLAESSHDVFTFPLSFDGLSTGLEYTEATFSTIKNFNNFGHDVVDNARKLK